MAGIADMLLDLNLGATAATVVGSDAGGLTQVNEMAILKDF